MKRISLILFCLLVQGLNAQYQTDESLVGSDQFLNPIFNGDYADPSILVDGDKFYMVHSSFESYPGLVVWHSKDLINWQAVATALTQYVGSVWAPDLVKHNNRYFIYFPASNKNYVVYADQIEGEWSDPVELNVEGIDPGHVADENGNRYLYFNNGGYVPLSKDGLRVTGQLQPSYQGWEIPRDWQIECMCMEGPKLFKRGEYYYLTVAEGGTAGPATGHMVISARSRSPLGPWENSPHNPILRTESSHEKWWSVGHASILEAKKNDWWMIFHGYEKGHYNRGRQTMLAAVEWTHDGWFKVADDLDLAKPLTRPDLSAVKGTHTHNDAFNADELKPQWQFFGEYDLSRFSVSENGLEISGKGNVLADSSPLLFIPAHPSYTAQVEMEIPNNAIGGLVMFYSKKASSGILADRQNIRTNLRGWEFVTEENAIENHVFLRIQNIDDLVNMYYSTDNSNWKKIATSLEVSGYHHNALNDFLSLKIGLVAMGEGKVRFKNFEYRPLNSN